MNSRSWLLIVIIGVLSVCAFGIMAKVAVESNPNLQRLVEFKTAVAETFAAHGVSEASVRRLADRREYEIVLQCQDAEIAELAEVDRDVADYFVRNYHDANGTKLKIKYVPKPQWGCGSSASRPLRQAEVELYPLRLAVRREQRIEKLQTVIDRQPKMSFRSVLWNQRDVTLEVQVLGGGEKEPEKVSRWVESQARTQLRGFYKQLRVRLWGASARPDVAADGHATGQASRPTDPASSLPAGDRVEKQPQPLYDAMYDAHGRLRK